MQYFEKASDQVQRGCWLLFRSCSVALCVTEQWRRLQWIGSDVSQWIWCWKGILKEHTYTHLVVNVFNIHVTHVDDVITFEVVLCIYMIELRMSEWHRLEHHCVIWMHHIACKTRSVCSNDVFVIKVTFNHAFILLKVDASCTVFQRCMHKTRKACSIMLRLFWVFSALLHSITKSTRPSTCFSWQRWNQWEGLSVTLSDGTVESYVFRCKAVECGKCDPFLSFVA